MNIAKNEKGELIEIEKAVKGDIYYCLVCNGEVIAKKEIKNNIIHT